MTRKLAIGTALGITGLAIAAAVTLGSAPAAQPAELNNSSGNNQGSIQSRIDQLARQQPHSGAQPANPPASTPAAGSFPRSFLIPGTNTSVNISGSINATASYRVH